MDKLLKQIRVTECSKRVIKRILAPSQPLLSCTSVTYRADDPDLDSDLDSMPLILHFSSDSFHGSHLVFAPLICIIHVL
jgi:hypothetical protein